MIEDGPRRLGEGWLDRQLALEQRFLNGELSFMDAVSCTEAMPVFDTSFDALAAMVELERGGCTVFGGMAVLRQSMQNRPEIGTEDFKGVWAEVRRDGDLLVRIYDCEMRPMPMKVAVAGQAYDTADMHHPTKNWLCDFNMGFCQLKSGVNMVAGVYFNVHVPASVKWVDFVLLGRTGRDQLVDRPVLF